MINTNIQVIFFQSIFITIRYNSYSLYHLFEEFIYVLTNLLFEGDGADIQSALGEWTGLSTVPNVFIGGKHIGGCDSKPSLFPCSFLVFITISASFLCY